MIPFAANALRCIANGEENPKTAPSLWDFVTLPEEDRATAISNMHRKKFSNKDRACGSGDMLVDTQTDRQTDTHAQTYSSQYLTTAPEGEVVTE